MVKRKVMKKKSKRSFSLSKPFDVSYAPSSIKIVAGLFYVLAALNIIFGIFTCLTGLIGSIVLFNMDPNELFQLFPEVSMWQVVTGGQVLAALIFIGIIIMLWGAMEIFIARGLRKGNKLAFVAASIILILGFLMSLTLLFSFTFSALMGLVIYGVFGYMLLFDKNSRRFFDLNAKSFKAKKRR